MTKKAIVVGCDGQDGKIIFEYLRKRKYAIIGIGKSSVRTNASIWNKKTNITKEEDVSCLIKQKPDEVYYLAAFHNAAQEKISVNTDFIQHSYSINVFGLINFLEAIRKYSPITKLFYASSSHIFGNPIQCPQSEETCYNPTSIYGITKLDGLNYCRLYRKHHGTFTSVGILYNHESHYRRGKFISKKIINAAINIKNKKQRKLTIGNLNTIVDWGYAYDFVDGMHAILQLPKPDDFIIATGKGHTVAQLCEAAFAYFGLDWRKYVEQDKAILLNSQPKLIGNYNKLNMKTGWRPETNFEDMIKNIIKSTMQDYI